MAHQFQLSLNLNFSPNPPPGTTVAVQHSPIPLERQGFNLLVEISTSSAFLTLPNAPARKTIAVMAHFDTGASMTTVDTEIAAHLNLLPTGRQKTSTAGGLINNNTYAVDLVFLNSQLRGVQNLQIGSCPLPHFNLNSAISNPADLTNFGVLIGRDLMSKWNITWHGPTSTILLSD